MVNIVLGKYNYYYISWLKKINNVKYSYAT